MIATTNNNILVQLDSPAPEVLHVFDVNLDELTISNKDDNFTYTIKFKNDPQLLNITTPLRLGNVLSSGTIKGQQMGTKQSHFLRYNQGAEHHDAH